MDSIFVLCGVSEEYEYHVNQAKKETKDSLERGMRLVETRNCLIRKEKNRRNIMILPNCSSFTRVFPKVSGLAARSENCKWYSSLPLGAVVSLLSESV
jgi:hypothetical protein